MKKVLYDNVTLLAEEIDSKLNVKAFGFYYNDNPDNIYIIDRYSRYVVNGCVNIDGEPKKTQYIKDIVRAKLEDEINKYINEHINNEKMYDYDLNGKPLKYELHYFIPNENIVDEYVSDFCNEQILDVTKGLVRLTNNRHQHVLFNLKTNEFVDFNMKVIFYESDIYKMIMQEQYKRGIIKDEFVKRVFEFNEFLKDKKSLKLKFKNDDTLYEYKSSYGSVYASTLLNYKNNKIYVYDSYYLKPRLNNDVPIEELEYFKYGNKIFKF